MRKDDQPRSKDDQPRIDTVEDMFDACFGSAVFLNEKSIDEALKARLSARTRALNDVGTQVFDVRKGEPANQTLSTHKRTRKAA